MEYLLPFEREALEKGLEKGKQQGLEESRQRGQAELITRQLSKRFGPLPDRFQQRLAGATTDQLEAWADALWDADSLDDIFGPPQPA